MKYIKLFESYDDELTRAQAQLAELDDLRDFAILSAEEYANQSSSLLKVITAHNRKIIKQASQTHKMYSDEWYSALAEHPSLSWLVDLKELPEYSEFLAAGLHPASSLVQLGNRTMVFARDPEYTAGTSYAIGLFSSINVVRRLTPDVMRYGKRQPTLDQKVKSLDGSLVPLQFFKEGMRWVLDNLDLTDSSFPNKKTVAAAASREDERSRILGNIHQILGSSGVQVDDSLEIIPIDGLSGYANMGDLRKLSAQLKRSAAKGGPLEVPLTQWTQITQAQVDAMSRFPNVVWVIGPNQIVVYARNTRGWRIKPADSQLGNVTVPSPLAADDLLRKFEEAGVKSIERLAYPVESINLSDYPGLRIGREENDTRRL